MPHSSSLSFLSNYGNDSSDSEDNTKIVETKTDSTMFVLLIILFVSIYYYCFRIILLIFEL
jgi:hypothetical protein